MSKGTIIHAGVHRMTKVAAAGRGKQGAAGEAEGAASAHVQFQLHMQSKLCSSCCISRKLMTMGQGGIHN